MLYAEYKKPAGKGGLLTTQIAELELVNQACCHNVISVDAVIFGEVVVIQQVDFVINVGRHVFIEVVSRANRNVFHQILVTGVGAVDIGQILTL